MSVTRFDNEYPKFLEAQDQFYKNPEAQGVLTITSPTQLMEYVDPMKLQGRLDRIAELRFEKSQHQYLEVLGGFDKDFLDHLEKGVPPTTRVLAKGKNMKVTVTGSLADLALWEVPVELHIRDLYYNGVASSQDLEIDALVQEGVRRFQVKGDMIRNSGVRFVEAGTRYRYTFEWYSLLVQVIVGDMGDLLLGTTNLAMAMAFGLTPVANQDARRVHAPSLKELEAVVDEEGKPVVVTGANAFQMAHLYSHLGDLVTFEWDRDLTGDMGPSGRFLPLEAHTIPKTG